MLHSVLVSLSIASLGLAQTDDTVTQLLGGYLRPSTTIYMEDQGKSTDPGPSITLYNSESTLVINTNDLSTQEATIQDQTRILWCVPTEYVGETTWAPTATGFLHQTLPVPICGQVVTLDETPMCLREYGCIQPSIVFAGDGGAATVVASTTSTTASTATPSMRTSVTAIAPTTAVTFGATDSASSMTSTSTEPSTATQSGNGNGAAKARVGDSVVGVLGLVGAILS